MAFKAVEEVSCGPPWTITAEEGDLIPHMNAKNTAISYNRIAMEVVRAFTKGYIDDDTTMRMLQNLKGRFRDLETAESFFRDMCENRDSAIQDIIVELRMLKRQNTGRGNVPVEIRVEPEDIDKYAPLRDKIVALGYESCSIVVFEDDSFDVAQVQYSSTPEWMADELLELVDDAHGNRSDYSPETYKMEDSDYPAIVIWASIVIEEEDEDEPTGFTGLGSLFSEWDGSRGRTPEELFG
jgi:hypothetical protein